MLFGIRAELLPRMMLPVGGFEKSAIRQMAAQLGLRVADKKDSQEICFVTRDRYDDFIRRRRADENIDIDTTGELVTTDGEVVGRHRASKASRSASGRAWAWRSVSGSLSCGSTPSRGES